jgi:uncharacterized membrane protein
MAVFMLRIETDFVEYYDKFYGAVRSGGSLEYIEDMRDEMVYSIKQGLAEIGKIQTLAVLVTFVAGPLLLKALDISELYLPLLYIQVIGASLQVVLLSVLNIFFYLDQRRIICCSVRNSCCSTSCSPGYHYGGERRSTATASPSPYSSPWPPPWHSSTAA